MKQPIITRDLERKAIYTDIVYDPEWTYVEVTIGEFYDHTYTIQTEGCDYRYIVDWGDGCIEKSEQSHEYKNEGTYTLRIKGHIIFIGDKCEHGIFDKKRTTKALQYGTKFDTNIAMFKSCDHLVEINPGFFTHKKDLVSIANMFKSCGLKSIPDGLFDPLINLTDVSNMFQYCYDIDYIPEKMFTKCPHIRKVDYMLCGAKIHKIPDDLLDGLDELESAEGVFCSLCISKIPIGLFKNKRNLTNLNSCFLGCRPLKEIPDGLFDDCINLQSIEFLFGFSGLDGGMSDDNTPSDLFSKCPNITKTENAFAHTNLSEQKQNEILSNIGSYYNNK